MSTIEVEHLVKSFGSQRAVNDVSFSVNPGEIFGLLGPNGAGKTTTIRIILDLFKADSGKVAILGGPMTESKKNKIGYLPEERGLYQDINLDVCLNYLATLKGLKPAEARKRIDDYLVRFDLAAHRKKKLKELSKGMQQKAQLIVTLVHDPELVIIDEPFSALDPVNTEMVKNILREERDRGKTIVMCTHQMHQVEELCDRLVLIDKGRSVLYGRLEEIQKQFAGREVRLRSATPLPAELPGADIIEHENGSGVLVRLQDNVTPQQLLKNLIDQNCMLEKYEVAMPDLDEIFIRVVKGEGSEQ